MNREAMRLSVITARGTARLKYAHRRVIKQQRRRKPAPLSAPLGNRNNGLPLASLEATLGLIDHVNAALAAHDTIVAVTPAQRFQ
jgi:hypothetical protein